MVLEYWNPRKTFVCDDFATYYSRINTKLKLKNAENLIRLTFEFKISILLFKRYNVTKHKLTKIESSALSKIV